MTDIPKYLCFWLNQYAFLQIHSNKPVDLKNTNQEQIFYIFDMLLNNMSNNHSPKSSNTMFSVFSLSHFQVIPATIFITMIVPSIFLDQYGSFYIIENPMRERIRPHTDKVMTFWSLGKFTTRKIRNKQVRMKSQESSSKDNV